MRPARLERATYSFGGCHSIQLSYGRSSAAIILGASGKHNCRARSRQTIAGLISPRNCATMTARQPEKLTA